MLFSLPFFHFFNLHSHHGAKADGGALCGLAARALARWLSANRSLSGAASFSPMAQVCSRGARVHDCTPGCLSMRGGSSASSVPAAVDRRRHQPADSWPRCLVRRLLESFRLVAWFFSFALSSLHPKVAGKALLCGLCVCSCYIALQEEGSSG